MTDRRSPEPPDHNQEDSPAPAGGGSQESPGVSGPVDDAFQEALARMPAGAAVSHLRIESSDAYLARCRETAEKRYAQPQSPILEQLAARDPNNEAFLEAVKSPARSTLHLGSDRQEFHAPRKKNQE